VLDTPPILYAADASLMSTICHGSVLVVRLGHTTIDTVTRAMQSLCTNNVVGTIVNGARQGELYSRYRYYRYYYEPRKDKGLSDPLDPGSMDGEPVGVSAGSSSDDSFIDEPTSVETRSEKSE
jgi:Mrp family chromosome partitioning ATPase